MVCGVRTVVAVLVSRELFISQLNQCYHELFLVIFYGFVRHFFCLM